MYNINGFNVTASFMKLEFLHEIHSKGYSVLGLANCSNVVFNEDDGSIELQ